MTVSSRRAVLLAALGLGCAGPTPPVVDAGPDGGECASTPATLELGTAVDGSLRAFRALAEGDPVSLTPGPQGGQHIWIALRGTGFDPTLPRVELRAVRPSDNALIGRLRIRLPMVPAPEDPTRLALSAQTLFVEDRGYCTVLGGDVRVELAFDDLHGHCATVTRTVRLADIDPAATEAVRDAWRRCCAEHLPRCYEPTDGGVTADAAADAAPD